MTQIKAADITYADDALLFHAVVKCSTSLSPDPNATLPWGIFSPHRRLRPPGLAVPGVSGAGGLRGPRNRVGLGEPSVVQPVGHQGEGVSLRRTRGLHHPRRRGGGRPGDGRHHPDPHLHHHPAE